MANPYQGLSDFCFWSRSMTAVHPGQVDPVTKVASILPEHKVATMGSCFAQHLAKHIKSSGLNYYVAETAPLGMTDQAATEHNYGVFSARYGNVYTVKQAVQLFDRAFGDFSPLDAVWEKKGRYVDAFRPQVEPDGYATVAEVKDDAVKHLAYVSDIFTKADWFIFTLGLTEAWRSKQDGAIYPIAPGVSGGEFDASKYEFVNFSCEETQADLCLLIEKIQRINPDVKILLTVSPVPLIATYENRHVWVSTSFSKAALRVAADVAERRYENIIYFPSYEIITSPAAGGNYYEDDLRQIKEVGVKHVMRVFGKHFFPSNAESFSNSDDSAPLLATFQNESGVVCDEEVIERALRASGYSRDTNSQSQSAIPNRLTLTEKVNLQCLGNMMVKLPVPNMVPSEQFTIDVSIINRSQQVWAGDSLHPVNCCYHWLKISGEVLVFEGLRSALPSGGVVPGLALDAQIQVNAPQEQGTYILVLTLVQEGVYWFEDQGFEAVRMPVEVVWPRVTS